MAQPALESDENNPELLPTNEEKDLVRKIKKTHTHEIVIGLCGPIGAPMEMVALRLQAILKNAYDYDPAIIKLSSFIEKHAEPGISAESGFARYTSLIEAGNRMRSTFGHSVLAELAIADISVKRELARKSVNAVEYSPQRFCHIIDSIKNQEEMDALRSVYKDLFVCIGVYASRDVREVRLSKLSITDAELSTLIDRDSGEEKDNGQTVRDTFPLADFFINGSSYSNAEIDNKLSRIVDLILGAKVITPSQDETAMYTAFTASLNSACLSRQVGAAVTDQDGYLLGIGWNDVPKFGGGVYAENANGDRRCFNYGSLCYNDQEKEIISSEIAKELLNAKIINTNQFEPTTAALKKSRIRGLIEFSRAVHAEMLALLNAGRSGGPRMQAGKIYVTTYPCHSCARHIIAAGIHEIIYIEPYPKSLAMKLHNDALTEGTDPRKVKLLPFEGVSPARYPDFFRMGQRSRKLDGKLNEFEPKGLNFKAEASLKSLPMLEKIVVEKLTKQKLLSTNPEANESSKI